MIKKQKQQRNKVYIGIYRKLYITRICSVYHVVTGTRLYNILYVTCDGFDKRDRRRIEANAGEKHHARTHPRPNRR